MIKLFCVFSVWLLWMFVSGTRYQPKKWIFQQDIARNGVSYSSTSHFVHSGMKYFFLWKIWWYVVKDILFQQVTMSSTKYFSFLCLCWLETDSTTVLEPYAVSIKTSTLRVTGSIRFLLRALVINHHHFPFNILFAGHSSFKTATKSQHNNEPRAGQNNFSWKDFEDIYYRDWYFFG